MAAEEETERVTVTLGSDAVERARHLIAAGRISSLSAYASNAVSAQLARDDDVRRLRQLWPDLTEEDLTAARHAWEAGNVSERPAQAS
jgi:hypothetical protein